MDLVFELPVLPSGGHYKLYFDYFFTSLKLLDLFTEMSIGATGTVSKSYCKMFAERFCNNEKARGSYDYRCDT